jgi:hypothetical protein
MEMVLEDTPPSHALDGLLRDIITASHNFAVTDPRRNKLSVFESAMKNIVLFIMQYSQKRNIEDTLKGKEVVVSGLGTWTVTDTLEFKKRPAKHEMVGRWVSSSSPLDHFTPKNNRICPYGEIQ